MIPEPIPKDTDFASVIEKYRSFIHRAADLVISYGGSLSGKHRDGQSRGELLPKMFGPELIHAFHEFKAIRDPDWKMNPGKVIDPHRVDDNLRLGVDYRPPQVQTHFKFPGDDQGSFARATLRCVGVGECFPASFVPRVLLQNGPNSCNCRWIFSLQDLIGDSATQHVAGDVPGSGFSTERVERRKYCRRYQ
jgi:hypothetical protein